MKTFFDAVARIIAVVYYYQLHYMHKPTHKVDIEYSSCHMYN